MIIRRPHAYTFRRDHPDAPIPGLVVLDAGGKLLGSIPLPSRDVAGKLAGLAGR